MFLKGIYIHPYKTYKAYQKGETVFSAFMKLRKTKNVLQFNVIFLIIREKQLIENIMSVLAHFLSRANAQKVLFGIFIRAL